MRCFLLAMIILLAGCRHRGDAITRPLVQNITESVYASGMVESRNQYEVFSTINGIVAQIGVAEGDIVQPGEVILTLVNETQRLSAENARIAATYSSLPYNADRLKQLKLNIGLAQARMLHDSGLYSRQQNLWKEGIGSRNELEQRELAWKNAADAYRVALLQYRDLKKEIDFAAQQSLKNLQITKSLGNDYLIRARQKGKVYRILKEPGEMVTMQTPVAVIGDINEFVLKLQVDEYDIGKIKAGQKVYVSLDSYRGQVFEAAVQKVQPFMNNRSRSFEVEAIFISKPPRLYPNLTVEANILISKKDSALTIPRNYLAGEDHVLLKNGEKRKVTTGLKDYQRIEITGGLSRDDQLQKPPQ